jgi:hypothetical protein
VSVAAMCQQEQVHNGDGHSVCFSIGGMSFALRTRLPATLHFDSDLARFRVEEVDAECDLEITLEVVEGLARRCGRQLFDSGSLWSLYREKNGFAFDLATPVLGREPYKRLMTDHAFSRARLLVNGALVEQNVSISPLEYPLDELLVSHWLARGRGVELHGCGLVDAQAGPFLFLGHSGAGKSTTTRLWTAKRNVQVLSDDRVILRRQRGEIWMYGTPWHGEAGFASPQKACVERIFFLEHGHFNRISELPMAEAAAELFARSFVPFHDAALLESVLAFLHDVAGRVPCYRYQFRPDVSAVDTVLNFHG